MLKAIRSKESCEERERERKDVAKTAKRSWGERERWMEIDRKDNEKKKNGEN